MMSRLENITMYYILHLLTYDAQRSDFAQVRLDQTTWDPCTVNTPLQCMILMRHMWWKIIATGIYISPSSLTTAVLYYVKHANLQLCLWWPGAFFCIFFGHPRKCLLPHSYYIVAFLWQKTLLSGRPLLYSTHLYIWVNTEIKLETTILHPRS